MHSTNVMVFSQLEFKTAGTYFIEVLVDDVMKIRYPVPVVARAAADRARRRRRRNLRPDELFPTLIRSPHRFIYLCGIFALG